MNREDQRQLDPHQLLGQYRALQTQQSPPELDARILAYAARAQSRKSRLPWLATAAAAVLAVGLSTFLMNTPERANLPPASEVKASLPKTDGNSEGHESGRAKMSAPVADSQAAELAEESLAARTQAPETSAVLMDAEPQASAGQSFENKAASEPRREESESLARTQAPIAQSRSEGLSEVVAEAPAAPAEPAPPPPAAMAPAPAETAAVGAAASNVQADADAKASSTPEAAKRAAQATDAPLRSNPLDPDEWLRQIRALLEEGHVEAARISLGEWQRRFPQRALPDDLRALLEPPKTPN
jgi:hypothetical protein